MNADTGAKVKTDAEGRQCRIFNSMITGKSSPSQRHKQSLLFKNEAILPEVPETMQEKHLVTEMLNKTNLGHFVP